MDNYDIFYYPKINITLITISLLMIFFTMLGMIAIDVKEEKILNKINCTTYSRHNIYQYDEYFIINKWYICKTENYLLFLDDELQPIPLTKEQYELIFEKTKNQLKPLYIEGNIIDIYRENKIDTRIVVIEL